MNQDDAKAVWAVIKERLPEVAARVEAEADGKARESFAERLRGMVEQEERKRSDAFASALFDEIRKTKKKPEER